MWIGTLFLFFSCSSRTVNSWVLRDVHSLDANIMITKQWLKQEQSNHKYLQKIMKKEMDYHRKKDFKIYKKLEGEMRSLDKSLKKIKSSLSKQIKLATKIKKRPSLSVFDSNQEQGRGKKGLFGKKKNNNPTTNKSEKELKVIQSLEKNSIVITENQSNYNRSKEALVGIFKKNKYRLVFIREQVKKWNHHLKDLSYDREKLVPTIDGFDLILSEALFKSADSDYANNIISLSKRIEKYNNDMDRFESYVINLESIARKQANALVYLIKEDQEKKYEIKYKKDLIHYQKILKELPKLIESI